MRRLRLACLPLVLLVLFLQSANCHGEEKELQVFILHSYHQEYPWTKREHDGFVSAFAHLFPDSPISFETEYLDTKRVPFTGEYRRFFRDYLSTKYSEYRPDLIFATDDNSLRFLVEYKDGLFGEVPVVFCGVNDVSVAEHIDTGNISGVFEVKDVEANLELISRFYPDISSILVVGDASPTYRAIKQDITSLITGRRQDLEVEFIADHQLTKVVDRLADHSEGFILLTTIGGFHNGARETIPLDKVIEQMVQTGQFTIISMEDVYMVDGVLGGIVTSGTSQGQAAAELSAQVLNGQGGDTATVPGPNIPTFDYGELTRSGVDLKLLPLESLLLNKPRSLYLEYRELIWSAVASFVFLLTLLIFLSLNVVRRKKAEQALAAQENFLNSVVDNIPDMIFVKRAEDLRFVRFNQAGCDIVGVSAEYMVGKNDYDFFPEKEADFYTAIDRKVLKSGQLVDIPEEPIQTSRGSRILHTKKMVIADQEGNPAYLLGISRDITEKKEREEKRRELEERLQQAEKMESLGTLAGGIAHDFNNILSSIIGYTELAQLEAQGGSAKLGGFLDGALKGANRARDLTRQILTFSRKSEPQKLPIDLKDVTDEALQLLRSSLPSTISIERDLQPGTVVLGDPSQLNRIILNLCTNGYQAMQEQGGVLGVSLKEMCIRSVGEYHLHDIPPGRYVRLEVGDTGCGMDDETRQRMFDPYFTTKGAEAGTGLGLAVVHGIVKNHNGYVHVYSEEGQGTTIHVYFPFHTEAPVIPDHPRTGSASELGPGGSEHILLVDDEEALVEMTRSVLERFGYRVTPFTDGLAALKEVVRDPDRFDLLVTDMTMPNITGAELAREVMRVAPSMQVILCTGHSELINREKAMEMGIGAYCEKPLPIDELLTSIRKVMDTRDPGKVDT